MAACSQIAPPDPSLSRVVSARQRIVLGSAATQIDLAGIGGRLALTGKRHRQFHFAAWSGGDDADAKISSRGLSNLLGAVSAQASASLTFGLLRLQPVQFDDRFDGL